MMLTINGPIYIKGLRSPTQKFIAHSITPTALISSLFSSSNKDVKSQRIHEPRLFYYYYYYIPLIMSFGHFHMGLRWIDLWVTACLGLWSPLAPNVHSYAVDAIISSQVLPLPSASVSLMQPQTNSVCKYVLSLLTALNEWSDNRNRRRALDVLWLGKAKPLYPKSDVYHPKPI